MNRTARAIVALVCLVLIVACKGESGVSPIPLGVTPDFQAGTATPGSGSVSLQKVSVSGEHITLDVVVTDVSEPISGIAFRLRFPGDIALFESCIDGNLLPAGTCYVSQTPLHEDEVSIGRTISSSEVPVPVAGSRTIVQLRFLVFGVGGTTDNVVFLAPNLGGGDASALLDANVPPEPILVNWYGGTLTGR